MLTRRVHLGAMPMLAFFPWPSLDERLTFEPFELVPYGLAEQEGMIPAAHRDAVEHVLRAYQPPPRPGEPHRARRDIALLRRRDRALTAELSEDEDVPAYFRFRSLFAFGLLAGRELFGHRYANSDDARLVIHGFQPEQEGGAMVVTPRRDGSHQTYITRSRWHVPRPLHTTPGVRLTRDVDVAVVRALIAATAGPDMSLLEEAVHLFVGANTDNPEVGAHSELIDMISAFSRCGGGWTEHETVTPFVSTLPSRRGPEPRHAGPKASAPLVQAQQNKGRTLREIWLRRAYGARSQVGHGNLTGAGYPDPWTAREHLLLAAFIFPLYVKRQIAERGLYEWTGLDETDDAAFDTLITLAPFDSRQDAEEREGAKHAWSEVRTWARCLPLAAALAALYDREEARARAAGQDGAATEAATNGQEAADAE